MGEDEVVVSNLRRGGTHAYGGAWAAHLLAAAGVLVMLASIAGFVGITTGVTAHLWTHFFFCAFAWSFAVAAAHTLLEHSDDTKRYLASHWQVIQTGVVGDNVAAEDAAAAIRNGAKGIGLVRTEHMFFSSTERVHAIREFIIAQDEQAQKVALEKLEKFQYEDFKGILKSAGGFPVTMRLIDPPLHEFLPSEKKLREGAANETGLHPAWQTDAERFR